MVPWVIFRANVNIAARAGSGKPGVTGTVDAEVPGRGHFVPDSGIAGVAGWVAGQAGAGDMGDEVDTVLG
jgi:hypothetical protein